MSQENVEIVRRAHAAWNAQDREAFIAELHAEIEWHSGIGAALGGSEAVYVGHDGAREAWEEYRGEALGDLITAVDEIRDLGDSALLLGHFEVTGRSTALGFRREFGQLLRFRDRRMVSSHDFLSHSKALEAAGLPG
jgi:ketosteroid isomerase-like protein